MMTRRRFFSRTLGCAGLAMLLPGGVCTAQTTTTAAPPALVVAGDVSTPLSLTLAELKTLPRMRVEVEEDGRVLSYEGVLVGEILKRAGVPLGTALRGNVVATYVLASTTDDYQVVFSLAELDPGFTNNDVIVADTVEGKPLFAYQGQLRIVAPRDTRAARSVRLLERLEVVRLRK